jgi:hypothetical protein
MSLPAAACLACVMAITGAATAVAQTPAPADAYLYIISPRDGERIGGPFWVRFGLRNMGVTRAGDTAPNVGHHHLLVDVEGELNMQEPIATDRKHLHFGSGQTETRLDLPPGRHTLQLVLGDAEHKVFSPAVISKRITVTVLPPRPRRAKGARSRGRS